MSHQSSTESAHTKVDIAPYKINLHHTFFLPSKRTLRVDKRNYATCWFSNEEFERMDVYFRLVFSTESQHRSNSAPSQSNTTEHRIVTVQLCTSEQLSEVMVEESRRNMDALRLPDVVMEKKAVEMVVLMFEAFVEGYEYSLYVAEQFAIKELPYESSQSLSISDDFPADKSFFKLITKAKFSVPEDIMPAPLSANPAGVLRKLHDDGLLSDVILRVSEQRELRAHRCVLAANSPVFRGMFQHDLRESQGGVVHMKKADNETYVGAEVMEAALRHMYGGDLGEEDLDAQQRVELLVLAEQYELTALKAECEALLALDTSLDALHLLTVAHDHRAERLKRAVIRRLKSRRKRKSLYSSATFKEMVKSHADLLEELFTVI